MSDPIAASTQDEALLSFLYMCPVGLLRTGADGDVKMMNPVAAQLLLPLTRKVTLQNLFDVLEPCAPELRGMIERFSAPSGSVCQQHRIFVSSSGPGPRVVACTLLKVGSDDFMAVLQDVTKQVEQERKIRQHEAMFAALVAGVHDFALFSLDENGHIDGWNQSCERQTGYTIAEVRGRDLRVLADSTEPLVDTVAEQVAEAAREGWSLRDRWCARRDGSRYWCQMMVAASGELDGRLDHLSTNDIATKIHAPIAGFAVVLRDVTQQRVTGEELRRLLTTDFLTGAVSRGHFFEIAEVEIAKHRQRDQPIAALMLDLDHFKRINDCFGHAAGDVVLKQFVSSCRAQLRACDVLARIGGEEFAVLLPETDLTAAIGIAERICRSVAMDVVLPMGGCLDGHAPPSRTVGISVGCAVLNEKMSGIDALLQAADAALYDAKRAGRGRVRSVG